MRSSTPPVRFSDGLSAVSHIARIEPGRTGLRVVGESGELLATWSFSGMYLAEEVYGNQPIRLMHREAGAACLTLADRAALNALCRQAPALRRIVGAPRRVTVRGMAWVLGTLALLAVAIVWGLPLLTDWIVPAIPWSWERTMGDQAVAAVEQSYPACEAARDAPGRRALERLVNRLAQSPAATGQVPPEGFTVHVLDSPIPNALAVPGGQILVFRALLDLTRTPAELAGVLAHETGHALARHPARGLLRSLGWRWLLSTLLGTSWAPESMQTLLTLAYTRDDERAADRMGLKLLEGEHLQSDGLARLLERLAADPKMSGRGIPAFLASHPLPEARARELNALAKPGGAAPWTEPEWRAIQELCGKQP